MTTVTDVEDALPYEDPTSPYQEAVAKAAARLLEDLEYSQAAKEWEKAATLRMAASILERIAKAEKAEEELDAEIEHYQTILGSLKAARIKALPVSDDATKVTPRKAPAKKRRRPSARRLQLVSVRTKDPLGKLLPAGEANLAFTSEGRTQLITVTDEDMAVLVSLTDSYLQGRGHNNYSYWD